MTINVWSHEADEDAKVAFRERAAKNLEAAHPGVHVKITWYEKNPLLAALKTALPAGQGPDVFYVEPDWTEYVDAGYLAPLDDLVNWNNIEPWARAVWVHNGKTYGIPQEAYTNEIYYNKDLLKKLGVELPANGQLTQAQFLDLVKKAKAADVVPIAQGVGDRPFPGAYIVGEALLRKLGKDDYKKLWTGKLSFEDPRVLDVLKWTKELVDAGAYPKNFMTLKLGESHYYFYTQARARCCSRWEAATPAAPFAPPDKGGQPADFPLGIMQFPAMDGGGLQPVRDVRRRRQLRHQRRQQEQEARRRPRTPNDNPFIESAFSTVKRAPEYPGRFLDDGQAVAYFNRYFTWYDTEHYHSGIDYVTPQQAHQGLRQKIVAQRRSQKLSQRRRRREENQKQITGRQKTNNQQKMTASLVA